MPALRKLKAQPSRAVLGGLAILESFDAGHSRQSLADISHRLRIPKATALRTLRALEEKHYVIYDRSDGRYALGIGVLALAQQYLLRYEALPIVRPMLVELARETGETAHFGVLQGPEVVYLEIAESPQRVRAYVLRGDHLPAHAVAAGKAILAHAAPAVLDAVLASGLPRLAPATITDRPAFLRELRTTRQRGYGLNIGEWLADVTGVSAPIFGYSGEVEGAIGVAGPMSRLDARRAARLGAVVRGYAERASQRLGGSRAA